MSDDWKYRDLPRAANGIAPAQWNPDTKQYEVYEGDRRIIDKLERIERRLNEPIDAQLTGSNVENSEFAVVFGRKIRNETETATIEVPKNVNSALIVLVIYGVTGIFNEGEGIRLISRLGINSSRTFPERDFYAVFSPYITDLRSNQVHAYTNFDVDEPSYFRNRSFITVKTILPTTIPIEIDIVGTFSSGEGIDCELYATFR